MTQRLLSRSDSGQPRPPKKIPAFWAFALLQAQRADDIGELVRAVIAHPRRVRPLGLQAFRVFTIQWLPRQFMAACALRDEVLKDERRRKRRATALLTAPPQPAALRHVVCAISVTG